jgi:RNA polymerase sigma factor (sigma-70 family)
LEPLDGDTEHRLTTKAVYDYRLVRKAVDEGDQQAYAELLQRYREPVYFMMMKMCGNRDDAEDLTIEAFGRAFKGLPQYTPDYAFSTWLFRIASNNAIDFIRKKKQKKALSIDARSADDSESGDYTAVIKSNTLDPEEHVIRKQKLQAVRSLVNNLKPHYKELIELFYFQELSHDAISKKLDIPVGTVKAQLFRAREFLYNALKGSQEKI